MPGSIILCVDSTSPFSYFTVVELLRLQPRLKDHGISTEVVPVFLGGIMQATGNRPPATLPARGKYLKYDLARAAQYYQTERLTPPPFFPMNSLLPQRCATFIKQKYDQVRFENVYRNFWIWVFVKHIDLAKPENMRALLTEQGFNEIEMREILDAAATIEVKSELNAQTKKCIEEYGAYGAPWFWLTRRAESGEETSEPCFGSDRWPYIFQFLELPFTNIELQPVPRL